MSAFSPHDRFSKSATLRVREVPEWGCLLVYTPDKPNVHYLDAHAWLVFELADGRELHELLEDFRGCVPADTPAADAEAALTSVLDKLTTSAVLVRAAADSDVPLAVGAVAS